MTDQFRKMSDLEGKVVVITGAGSGIGKAIALESAARKAIPCLVGRKLEALNAVAEIARAVSPQVSCYRCDLTDDKDISELAKHLERDRGRVDVLVNSAGMFHSGALETVPVSEFDILYRTNVRGPYLITQALLPMLRRYQGQIVFINSSAGLNASANLGQYAATKYALKAIADSLRQEVNVVGLRVLSIYPGRTATPMQAKIHKAEGKTYRPERLLQPDDVAATVISALTLPQTAEVTDIAIRPRIKP